MKRVEVGRMEFPPDGSILVLRYFLNRGRYSNGSRMLYLYLVLWRWGWPILFDLSGETPGD